MALEFTAIDPTAPEWDGPFEEMSFQAHDYIKVAADDQKLKLLSRMIDYWEDTKFERDELEELRLELAQVRKSLSPDTPYAELLAESFTRMDFVITETQGVGGYVEAIAD